MRPRPFNRGKHRAVRLRGKHGDRRRAAFRLRSFNEATAFQPWKAPRRPVARHASSVASMRPRPFNRGKPHPSSDCPSWSS
jgi:hypothetical protein